MPGSGLARAVLVCVWLAALSGCDAVKSEQNAREYVHELVTELCVPDGFYLQCWWYFTDLCHEEMTMMVVNALPSVAKRGKRLQPSKALRQQVLDGVFYLHTTFLSASMNPDFEKEACMDETLWKNVPQDKVGTMARLRASHEKWEREQANAASAPVTPTTPPAPAAGLPEPSPGSAPDPATTP